MGCKRKLVLDTPLDCNKEESEAPLEYLELGDLKNDWKMSKEEVGEVWNDLMTWKLERNQAFNKGIRVSSRIENKALNCASISCWFDTVPPLPTDPRLDCETHTLTSPVPISSLCGSKRGFQKNRSPANK